MMKIKKKKANKKHKKVLYKNTTLFESYKHCLEALWSKNKGKQLEKNKIHVASFRELLIKSK